MPHAALAQQAPAHLMTAAPAADKAEAAVSNRAVWIMLLALASAFSLSQAWRTVPAIMAVPLQSEWQLSPRQLGLFAGAFHFAFALMQFAMGIGIDLHGVRRTVLTAFPVAIAGSALAATAGSYEVLLAAQVLIGIGCAPAFLGCTVFIARHFPARRFAAVSGLTLGLGGIGLLMTGTPLASLIAATSWRVGFGVLGGLAVLAWLLVFWQVHEPAQPGGKPPRESIREALGKFAALVALPHTLGIVLLAGVGYASFISLRGLWLGPMLVGREGFSLVQSGHVALAMSVASLFGPPLFGRLDPGPLHRRRWIVGFTLVAATLYAVFAVTDSTWVNVAGPVVIGLMSGYLVLQYADVRGAYPAELTGRAMAVFTMAMFLGVALMQWFTGVVASSASSWGIDPFTAVFASMSALLLAGAAAFVRLPKPGGAAR